MIDTLSYVKNLEKVGIPRAQAEGYVSVLADAIRNRLESRDESLIEAASKHDFSKCRDEIIALRIELETMKAQIAKLKGDSV